MSGVLTTEQLLRVIDELAAASLSRWGLGGAELKLINHSENWTYRVTPKDAARPVILRVHRYPDRVAPVPLQPAQLRVVRVHRRD